MPIHVISCQALMPTAEKLAEEYLGRVKIQKENKHKFPDLRNEYKIGSIPTLLFIMESEIADKLVGVVPESFIREKLNNLIQA